MLYHSTQAKNNPKKTFIEQADIEKDALPTSNNFFDYPSAVRKIMYTINAIEAVNSSFRKVTKRAHFLMTIPFSNCFIWERVFTARKWYNEHIMRKKYETDLTNEQWEVIAPLFSNMRKYKWDKRELVNAVLYLVKTGCQWRNLPHDFPPVFTVHSFYRRARLNGLWDKILEHLVKLTRQRAGLSKEPTQALIDSQTVKTTGAVDQKGFDAGKKRKE